MTITLIAAVAENNALGKDNKMLWHLPNDFKHFKSLTSHHYIIMGRKTFESLPKTLPNRTHIVITRNKDYTNPNCIVVNSVEEALAACPKNEEVFIIGGGEIYKLFLPLADKIELTQVQHSFPDADAYFPTFNKENWEITREEPHQADNRHNYNYTFFTYTKKI